MSEKETNCELYSKIKTILAIPFILLNSQKIIWMSSDRE